MLRPIVLLVLVVAVGIIVSKLPEGSQQLRGWRRTTSGWERAENWNRGRRSPEVVGWREQISRRLPHPWVLGLGQILASMLVLAAFSWPAEEESVGVAEINSIFVTNDDYTYRGHD